MKNPKSKSQNPNKSYKSKSLKYLSLLMIWILFVICHLSFVILSMPVQAQTKAEAAEELSKGEAVMRISASDFMRRKIGELLSWTIGYDISKVSRIKLTPTINYIIALPRRVPPDGRTIIEIMASVDDPGGLKNISGVRADLSSIGRLPNTMLVDNGLFGDREASDGVYTLQTSVSPRIKLGEKEVPVAVANKRGWLALAKTSLDIKINPVIIDAIFVPDRTRAGVLSPVTLTVKLDNPGRIEDMEKVTADLRIFGYKDLVLLRNDGREGDAVAGDNIYSLRFRIPRQVVPGDYSIRVGASNLIGGFGFKDAALKVEE